MDFTTAVRTCLANYVDFSGRARRSEFWFFMLFTFLLGIVVGLLDEVLGTDYDTGGGLLNTVASLLVFLPSLAVAVRRMHDIGRTGWWILLAVIPILGWIIVIVWWCTDSEGGDNRFGPHPRHGPSDGCPPPPAPYGSGQYGS